MPQFPRLVVVPASTDRSTVLLRRFYPQDGDDEAAHPWVAIATGFATGGGLELQKIAGLAASDARALIAQATANVAEGPRRWDVAEKSGLLFKKPSLLRGMGDLTVPVAAMTTDGGGVDDLASDLVLDEAFMAGAGAQLGKTALIAAIPKRGWLLVGKCRPGELPVMLKFAAMAKGIAGRGGRHALTTNCYFFQDGRLHGVSGDGYVSILTERDDRWNVS
jgi:hypothetical protein